MTFNGFLLFMFLACRLSFFMKWQNFVLHCYCSTFMPPASSAYVLLFVGFDFAVWPYGQVTDATINGHC